MDIQNLIKDSKEFIESKLQQSKKKFEIIYSSVKDPKKKEEMAKLLDQINADLKKLKSEQITRAELLKYEIDVQDLTDYINRSDEQEEEKYKILRVIAVEKLNQFSNNLEINSIWSYLNYFGREYLGLLSEQNLKLDFGHAFQRDKFFTLYNQTIRMVEEYGKILMEIESPAAAGNKEYKEQLYRAQGKEYRDVILKTGKFLRSVMDFIDDIYATEKNGEKAILEPDRIVHIKGELSCLEGLKAREALADLYRFIQEFIAFLKIPDLKKISDEEQ